MKRTVLFAPTAPLAEETPAHVTIEGEYGSLVWEGSLFTAAHHQKDGPYQGRHQGGTEPSPCNNGEIPFCPEGGVIGVSHFDLDTLGGVLRAQGPSGFFRDSLDSFWALAEFVDVNGPHKLDQAGASAQDLEYLYAFWAWQEEEENRFPRATEVTDVTDFFEEAGMILAMIFCGAVHLIEAGQAFKLAEEKLNRESFVECDGGVIVRVGPAFCNHLYVTPEGTVAKAVAHFNTVEGSVTISVADLPEGVSCLEIVQGFWGPESGGHDVIAGSPRGVRMGFYSLKAAYEALQSALV